jgi:hypothetical protein
MLFMLAILYPELSKWYVVMLTFSELGRSSSWAMMNVFCALIMKPYKQVDKRTFTVLRKVVSMHPV